jgi:copper chaperone CopZ
MIVMKTKISVKGMHCKSCEMLIMDVLEERSVIAKASREKNSVDVDFDENKISLSEFKAEIRKQGFKVE